MHMRPAGIIAKLAKEHPDSEVIMKANGKDIKAKAVMQIMAAGIKKGTEVELVVTGGNEQAVLDEFVIASAEDIQYMIPGYSYPIISVNSGQAAEIRCYIKDYGNAVSQEQFERTDKNVDNSLYRRNAANLF